jgi:hypothetical protein
MVRAFRLLLVLGLLAAAGQARAESPAEAISEEEYARFGEAMAGAVSRGDDLLPVKAIDSVAFLDRVLDGLKAPDEMIEGCRTGMLESLRGTLEKLFGTFKKAHYLRLDARGPDKRVLIRFINAHGDASYLGFVCERRHNGEIAWRDFHVYLFDEDFSRSMHRLLGPWLVGLAEHPGETSASLDALLAIAPVARMVLDGKTAEALAAIRNLPASQQKQDSVRLLHMILARQSDATDYARMVDEWSQDKPDDPALSLATFESAVLRRDYPTAIAHAARFEQLIGGDAYQEFLIGRLHHLASEPVAARLAARHALAQEPAFTPAYDLLLDLAVESGDTADVVDLLQEIEMRFPGADMAQAVATDPKYASTRASAIYAAWLRVRPPHPAKPPPK